MHLFQGRQIRIRYIDGCGNVLVLVHHTIDNFTITVFCFEICYWMELVRVFFRLEIQPIGLFTLFTFTKQFIWSRFLIYVRTMLVGFDFPQKRQKNHETHKIHDWRRHCQQRFVICLCHKRSVVFESPLINARILNPKSFICYTFGAITLIKLRERTKKQNSMKIHFNSSLFIPFGISTD